MPRLCVGTLEQDRECTRLEFWYTPPIHFAVREGNLASTEVLWEAYPFEEVTDLITLAEDRGRGAVADYLRDQIGGAAAVSDLRLHAAVDAADHAELERLLREEPGISTVRDPKGRTALHMAAIADDRAAVDTLLAGGAEVDTVDHQGFRPVHYACWRSTYWGLKKDATERMQVMLDGGATDSRTLAAVRGDRGAVEAFVAADPAAANDGDTLQKRPLSVAVEAGHRDLVRFLLDRGADPTLPESRTCPHGSALMVASAKDDLEVARWLLEAGAKPNGEVDSSGTPAGQARSDAMRGLMYGYGGLAPPAWVYAQRGDLETLGAILRTCDDPFTDEASEYLTTPYTAIISGWERDARNGEGSDAHDAMMSMFLRRKHPMPTVLTECEGYLYHVPRMTKQLLESGLNPNLHDWQRRTPLHDLCQGHRHVQAADELIRMFLEFGADINAIDQEARSTRWASPPARGNVTWWNCYWRLERIRRLRARRGRRRWRGRSGEGMRKWRR